MSLKHFCGLFGVHDSERAGSQSYLGLYGLQHRGQESTGIVTSDGACFHSRRCPGLVRECFEDEDLAQLKGRHAIGHNRYSTTGSARLANIQPLMVDLRGSPLAIAHNGNLVNALELRAAMEKDGSIFQSTTDSE